MADYGSDISTFPFDGTGRRITGARVVAEACLRRLMTQSGTLSYDPEYGVDLRWLLNEDLDASDLRLAESMAKFELEKDDRIRRANVSLALADNKLTVRIAGELADRESFAFTLGIDSVSASVLEVR